MAKTLGQIIAIAGSVALVATGIGAAGGLALFGTTAGISVFGASLGTLLTASSILAGVGALVSGLATPKAGKPQTTSGNKKDPISARVYLYGRRRMHGVSMLYETASDGTTVDVYAFLDGKADGYEQVYLNDDKVTVTSGTVQQLADKTYQKGRVKAYFTLGDSPNTAFSAVIAKLGGIWTSAHRGDGVVTGALLKAPEKEKDFLTTYPQGDSVQLSAVFRGQLCFDPRDGVTRYTENPVLHLLHYILVRREYDYQKRIAPTLQYWINAANICDEQVALREGGSEARYRSCISYEASSTPKEVYGTLLECFDGWLAPRGDGALIVYAGKLYEPTVTIGPDDILSYKLQNYIESESTVDQLKVTYISEAHDWAEVDCTPWGDEAGRRTEGFTPQTPSYSQARRLAKRTLARNNAPRRGSVTTTLAGRKVRGHRYVRLDLREAGYDPFDGMPPVVEVQTLQRDFEGGGITFEWVLVDENIDDWNPATEQGYPAQLGDSVPVVPAPAPTLTSATVQFSSTGQSDGDALGGNVQGVSGARILLNGTGPARDDLTWYARWRLGTDGAWSERDYTDIDPSANVQILTEYVPSAQNVQTQISYSNGNGVLSDWSNTLTVDTRMPD